MKQKVRAPRRKIAVEWTEESFGLTLQFKPSSSTSRVPRGLTEFLRHPTVTIGAFAQISELQEAA